MFVYSPQREMGQPNGACGMGLGLGMGQANGAGWDGDTDGERAERLRTRRGNWTRLQRVKVDMTIPFSTWLLLVSPSLDICFYTCIHTCVDAHIPFPIFWGRRFRPGQIEFVIVVEAGQFLDHMRHHHRVCRVQKNMIITHTTRFWLPDSPIPRFPDWTWSFCWFRFSITSSMAPAS